MCSYQRRSVELREQPIPQQHGRFLAAVLRTFADDLHESLQPLFEVLHPLRETAVLLAPAFVPGIDCGSQHLCSLVRNKVILEEQRHFVAVVLVTVGSVPHGLWQIQSFLPQEPVTLQQPVEDGALGLVLGELPFQRGVAGLLIEMAVERDDDDAVAGKQGHVIDYGQVVCVDVDLELRTEVKAVLMQETGVEGIVARHCLDLGGIHDQPFPRLRDVHKADTGEARDVLAGLCTVGIGLHGDGLRAGGAAVIAQHLQHAFAEGPFAVAGGDAVENGHALMPCVPGEAVPHDLLEELCPFPIAAHDLVDVGGEAFRVGAGVIYDRAFLGEQVRAAMLGELPRVDMESAVSAVEDIDVRVKTAVGDGMVDLGVFEDVDSVGVALPAAGVFHVCLSFVLVPDLQGKGVHEVCQFHAVFHGAEAARVWLPDAVTVEEPHLPLRHIAQAVLIEISEDMSGADVVPRIFGGVHRVKFRETRHTEVLACGGDANRRVKGSHAGERFGYGEIAIGFCTAIGVPLVAHQAGFPEQPVHLLTIPAAPESQYGTQGCVCLAVRGKACDFPAPEALELLSILGKGGFFDNAFIGEVAFAGNVGGSGGWDGAAHIGVEQPSQRLRCLRNIRAVEGAAGHREETIGLAGDVDFDVSLFDVVGLRVMGKAVWQQAEYAYPSPGRADLDVGI